MDLIKKDFAISCYRNDAGVFTQENIQDAVANEAALQVYLIYGAMNLRHKFHLATLMRTPGAEEDLILGLLYTENIINEQADVIQVRRLGKLNNNIWKVELAENVDFSPVEHQRNLLSSSSCGVCSQVIHPSLTATAQATTNLTISPRLINSICNDLANHQELFKSTGGAHGVALYSSDGKLYSLAEDVGRHNACDKIIGAALRRAALPLIKHYLVFSGRVSYELIQKANRCQIKIILSIGAPSALAVDLAIEYGITLIGFVRARGFNVYSHSFRVINQ